MNWKELLEELNSYSLPFLCFIVSCMLIPFVFMFQKFNYVSPGDTIGFLVIVAVFSLSAAVILCQILPQLYKIWNAIAFGLKILFINQNTVFKPIFFLTSSIIMMHAGFKFGADKFVLIGVLFATFSFLWMVYTIDCQATEKGR